jgi:predicted O-linked N-acetylglucosamine transferase (SPINDLY family)
MNIYEKQFDLAKQLHTSGRVKEAQKIYIKLLKIYKKNHLLLYFVGTTFLQLKKYDEAINNFEQSLKYNSFFPETYNNLGVALAEKKKYSLALNNYNKAINLKVDYADAYLNRGISFIKLLKYDEAISDFNIVISKDPYNSKAYNSLGNAFTGLEKYDQAIASFEKAIKINGNYLEAISNKANVFETQQKFKDSLNLINKIYKKDPNFSGLLQKIITNKMSIFEWEEFNELKEIIKNKLLKNKIILDPLIIYYLFDDLKIQSNNSKNYINNQFKNYDKINNLNKKVRGKKIKIGYFSGDFHNHPVMHIMADIFKNHDKRNFEIYAFSHGPDKKNNVWRKAVISYFKKFYQIYHMSNDEIINLANDNQLDIAVDLSGLTKYSRNELFYNRVAPIQINYLGYPGTSGLKSMDYIFADKNVIKENEKKYFTEKVYYLPGCYIPSANDIARKSSIKMCSRAEFNLPENKIIFCAFHNPLKINPDIFNVWMNILKKTENSVIWIKANDNLARENLKKETKKREVDPDRLIFARGVENINDHLKRLKLADIFLDTYPYNSHSTVYDYLKVNLPMIIMEGHSFPSRVGSSIYSSIGLSELIAKNYLDYENIAVNLANDKSKLLKIKKKINIQIQKNYLFNLKKFTQNLEDIYYKFYSKI